MKSSLGSMSSGASRGGSLVASVERTSAKDDAAPASRGKRSAAAAAAAAARGARFADLLGSELSAANDASPPSEAPPVEDGRDDADEKNAATEPDARATTLPQAREAPFGTPFAWPTEPPVDVKRPVLPSAASAAGAAGAAGRWLVRPGRSTAQDRAPLSGEDRGVETEDAHDLAEPLLLHVADLVVGHRLFPRRSHELVEDFAQLLHGQLPRREERAERGFFNLVDHGVGKT